MTVRAGQITANDVAGFLTAQGFKGRASLDGKLPDVPDSMVVVTRTGGPGESLEGAIDDVSFQLRCIGAQNDALSAETMAWDIDFMLCPPPPLSLLAGLIGAQYVTKVQRVGAPPTFFLLDIAGRTHLTGNYIFSVSRV